MPCAPAAAIGKHAGVIAASLQALGAPPPPAMLPPPTAAAALAGRAGLAAASPAACSNSRAGCAARAAAAAAEASRGGRRGAARRRADGLVAAASGSSAAEPPPDGEEEQDAELGDLQRQFQLAAARSAALEEYRMLMGQTDEALSAQLLRGAVLIARHRYPLLRAEDVEEQLDDLAVQVQGRLPEGAYPLKVLQTLSDHLYNERGLRGNSEDYYSPDNSCVNAVLDTRLGIPITLALIYSEVAARLGLPMHGVNVPGHFFLTPADPSLEFLVDAFEGGDISFLQDAEATLERIYGRPVQLDPAFLTGKRPVPPRVFLARMLNNLKQVYTMREAYAEAYAISLYMRATRPGDLEELRDSGVYLYHLKRIPECVEALTEFLARAPPDAEDAEKVRALLISLGQRSAGGGGEGGDSQGSGGGGGGGSDSET